MTTVFLSGSRKIGRISEDVRRRIDNMVERHLDIITGDANGADRAMQAYLAEREYPNVTIYYVGDAPRNNVGRWSMKNVEVKKKVTGRDFYAQKDKAMAEIADFGFVLWDGKSAGSVQNMVWLSQEGKKLVVYFAPEKSFYNINNEAEVLDLLAKCDADTLKDISRKVSLPGRFARLSQQQTSLDLNS